MNHGLRLVLNPPCMSLICIEGLQKDPFSNTIKSIIAFKQLSHCT
jgi:hypothetical protein